MGEPKPLPKPIGINLDYLRRGHPKDTYARAVVAKQGSQGLPMYGYGLGKTDMTSRFPFCTGIF